MTSSNMDIAQRLMLLQGITLIQNGIQFIEWGEKMPNEFSYDLFEVLRDRFQQFQESVLKGEHDNLIIDRVKKHLDNVKYGQRLNEQIQEHLQELRRQALSKQQQGKDQK